MHRFGSSAIVRTTCVVPTLPAEVSKITRAVHRCNPRRCNLLGATGTTTLAATVAHAYSRTAASLTYNPRPIMPARSRDETCWRQCSAAENGLYTRRSSGWWLFSGSLGLLYDFYVGNGAKVIYVTLVIKIVFEIKKNITGFILFKQSVMPN